MNSASFVSEPPRFLEVMRTGYQFSLKSKTTEGNSDAISFPSILYESIHLSVFVISSISWFLKRIVIDVDSNLLKI